MQTPSDDGSSRSLAKLRDPAALADPYPFYRRLREESPVHRDEDTGGWLGHVTRPCPVGWIRSYRRASCVTHARVLRVAGPLACIALFLLGCSKKAENAPDVDAAPRARAPVEPLPVAPSATASADVDARSPVDASVRPKRLPGKGRVACGKKSCDVSREICCQVLASDETTVTRAECAALAATTTQEEEHRIFICARVVEAATFRSEKVIGIECDDSGDCAEGEVCCDQLWGSGQPSQRECVVPTPGKRFTCNFGERCTGGATCRTPRSQCRGERCVITDVPKASPVVCGSGVCPKARPSCCGYGAPTCTKAGGCGPGEEVSCTRGSQCAEGEFCAIIALGGTFCAHLNDGMLGAACATAGDCAVFCDGRPASCDTSEWLGRCRCEFF